MSNLLLALLSPLWEGTSWPFCQGLTLRCPYCWQHRLTPGSELSLTATAIPLLLPLETEPASSCSFWNEVSNAYALAAQDPEELSFLGFYLRETGLLKPDTLPRHSKSDQKTLAAWKCKKCLFQQLLIFNGFTHVQSNSPNLILMISDL